MEQQENDGIIDIEPEEVKTDALFDENSPPKNIKEGKEKGSWLVDSNYFKTISILIIIISLCALAYAVGYQNGYVAALKTCEIGNTSPFMIF